MCNKVSDLISTTRRTLHLLTVQKVGAGQIAHQLIRKRLFCLFKVSLVPLALILYVIQRLERARERQQSPGSKGQA